MKNQRNEAEIKKGASLIVKGLGVNPTDENFRNTPLRLTNTILFYNKGLDEKKEVIKELKVSFPSKYKDIIVLKGLEGTSLCPHHFLPITYNADFAYIPKKRVTGASKPYKLFKTLAAQPIMQEDLTNEFISTFWKTVNPKGCIIVIRGKFFCYHKEGININESSMTTCLSEGCFKLDRYKDQFFSLIK